MNEEFLKARNRIIDENSESQTLLGMQATVRRLLSVMYYYEKPMTLDDMTELLGMSKASMSNAIRELDEIGLVKKVWKKGERKDIYVVEEDNYESFFKFFCYHWRKIVTPKTIALKKSVDELNALSAREGMDDETRMLIQGDLEKLHSGLAYLNWLSRLVESFESHAIFDFIPKNESIEMAQKK